MAPVTQRTPGERAVETNSTNKLRKLMVEKVRRDRINQSIEQLRALLNLEASPPGLETPPSRLEKADILEQAVGLLRRRALARAAPSYSQGFSQCLQETLRHLSLHAPLQPADREEIKGFYVHQRAALQRHVSGEQSRGSAARKWSSSRGHSSLWRPW
ncbi:transcription factor HES-5-like [Labrus bergylta]|uniref:transcription factor HES-5-like n=1 Tax=Labrus bergylta TaxID=56723 RepID=UPI003313866A